MFDNVYFIGNKNVKRFDIIQELIGLCNGRRVTKPYYKHQSSTLKQCNYGPVILWNTKALDALSDKEEAAILTQLAENRTRVLVILCRSALYSGFTEKSFLDRVPARHPVVAVVTDRYSVSPDEYVRHTAWLPTFMSVFPVNLTPFVRDGVSYGLDGFKELGEYIYPTDNVWKFFLGIILLVFFIFAFYKHAI